MDTKKYKHMALNLVTGEILCTERGHSLKRAIRTANRVNHKYGCYSNRWVFVHDGNVDRLTDKAK